MAQRKVLIDGLGQVILAKRRGSKHIRLSVNARGDVRINVPYWLPYEAGIQFALSRREWLDNQRRQQPKLQINHGSRIGKAHQLEFVESKALRSTIKNNVIRVGLPTASHHLDLDVQKAAMRASEKALKIEAEKLLPQRLKTLALAHDLHYSSVKIKKMHSRWGSCSNKAEITLSYYLIQLPWHLIDYVIMHELSHTVYLDHQPKFWQTLERFLPNVKQLRKEIKNYRPVIMPA